MLQLDASSAARLVTQRLRDFLTQPIGSMTMKHALNSVAANKAAQNHATLVRASVLNAALAVRDVATPVAKSANKKIVKPVAKAAKSAATKAVKGTGKALGIAGAYAGGFVLTLLGR